MLKTKWFEMTKPGIKKEDYREITPYWCSRILLYKGCHKPAKWWEFIQFHDGCFFIKDLVSNIQNGEITFKPFKVNTMTLGYPKSTDTERILRLEHKGIEIRTGNPEWGAVPDQIYFVILHGSILPDINCVKNKNT